MRENYTQLQKLKRKWLLMWLLLILPLWGLAQNTGITVSWDFQVGCNDVESTEPGKERVNVDTWESIDMGSCIRVCENRPVTYTVNPGNTNITAVTWGAAGGAIISTQTNPHRATIGWGAAGNGTVEITIHYANGTQETKSICIEKIDGPEVNFAVAGSGSNEVCQNTTVYFDNLSTAGNGTGIVSYVWDFGDGTPTSGVFEPTHVFANPGSYDVTLTVTNQCNCSRTERITIEVIEAMPVEISCAAVVCEGSVEKYTANNTCSGQWEVIGGGIVSQNGNEIEVKWDSVDPADGFGYVMYRSDCGCPAWTTVKIPVILGEAYIQGPTVVCTDKQYKYEMPRWPTTQVQWDIVSGPAPVHITYSSQRNEVFLKFDTPGTYVLSNIYENTLLNCDGKGKPIKIVVTEPLTITGGQPEVCTGNSLTFTSNGTGNVVWQVTHNGNVVQTQTTSAPFQYPFPNPGTYIITANTPGGCVGEGVVVKALPLPPAPTGAITGDQLVCAGVPYTYTLSPTNSGFIPVWSIAPTQGTIQGSNTGSSVTIVFNAGVTNYTVSVQNRTTTGLGCLSAPISYNVQQVNLNTISVQSPSPGTNIFCPSSSATFVANFNGIVPDDYFWTFDVGNFGSLLPDPSNPNAVIASFNEISNTVSSTNLNLHVVKCGQTKIISTPITLQTLPNISMAGSTVCEGNPTFPVTVTIPSSVTSGTLTFTFPDTSTENVNVTAGGTQTYTIDNHFVNNTTAVISQSLQLELTSPNGCNYIATTAANFSIIPELNITVTQGYHFVICPTATYSQTLSGQVPSGAGSVSYQWYKNNINNPIAGATGLSYTISNASQPSPGGSYFLVVTTNGNGCKSQSPSVMVVASCINVNPCTITPAPNLNVSAVWNNTGTNPCTTIKASATFVGTPTSFVWSGSPGVQVQPGSTANAATFNVTEAGVHNVILTLNYNGCKVQKIVPVTKNYQPDYNAAITCNTNGTYNVTLTDSSLLYGISPSQIAYSYTINGGNQQNGQTATYTGLQPGVTYQFAIKLDGPGTMPDCILSEPITMPTLPNLQFSVSGSSVCVGDVITLSIPPSNFLSDHTYKWFFAQTSFVANQAITDITINQAQQNAEIKLVVTTPNGCTYESIKYINVQEANLSPNLFGSNLNVCETSAMLPQLTVTFSGNASNYQWMNGSQTAGTTTVPYFSPTQSGSYWVILTDAGNGCLDKTSAEDPIAVTIRSTPQVSIVGSSQVCQNNTVTLQGIVTAPNLQYEWTRSYNGGASTVVQTGNSNTPIVHTSAPLAVGNYVYTLKVWSASDPTCFGSASFNVSVSSPPADPQVDVNISNCQPYEVQLSIQNPGPGTYNWSNGAYGPNITVNRGGLYQVIYTAPSGCTSSVQVEVPHSLEDMMWIFPTGCYDICPDDGFIIGPMGSFDNHEWQYFGNNQQGGYPGWIDPYWPNAAGTYNLWIRQGACDLLSGDMYISPTVDNPDCAPKDCKLDMYIKHVKREGNTFLIYGAIVNLGTQPVTVTLSSGYNQGTYSPTSIMIPAGGSYQMNPVIFYPDPNNFTGIDQLLITGPWPDCYTKVEIVFEEWANKSATPAYVQTESSMKMVPNPAREEVKISYDTGNDKVEATTLYIYDHSGILRHQEKLRGDKGEAKVNVSQWMQGMYLVTITTTADALQGKLLKE